jgi:hypothetical protein
MAYTLIETVTVGSGGASSIEFTGIPQEAGANLVVKFSARDTQAATINRIGMVINSDTAANYATKYLWGTGSSAVNAFSTSLEARVGYFNGDSSTANTFGNGEAFIPNYTSTAAKVISGDTVAENNATLFQATLTVTGYSGTDPITSLELITNGTAFAEHTTASLYLVTTADATGATGANGNYGPAKATGGTTTLVGGYWYHTFTSSGTLTPTEPLDVEVLVVAGGGGGGSANSGNSVSGGGGGAGGYLATTQSLSATGYAVTIGAGGAGGATGANKGLNGSNASFNALVAIGGGGGAGWVQNTAGSGGSGGGGTGFNAGSAGTGTGGQGNNGGGPNDQQRGGGGGGAGEAGFAATYGSNFAAPEGQGGDGLQWLNGNYYAGGGGGGENLDPATGIASGGLGGGGSAAGKTGTGDAGTANTGGGGAGTNHIGSAGGDPGAAGGSGVVIVRYAA